MIQAQGIRSLITGVDYRRKAGNRELLGGPRAADPTERRMDSMEQNPGFLLLRAGAAVHPKSPSLQVFLVAILEFLPLTSGMVVRFPRS